MNSHSELGGGGGGGGVLELIRAHRDCFNSPSPACSRPDISDDDELRREKRDRICGKRYGHTALGADQCEAGAISLHAGSFVGRRRFAVFIQARAI